MGGRRDKLFKLRIRPPQLPLSFEASTRLLIERLSQPFDFVVRAVVF
jgi:hypothetical protein